MTYDYRAELQRLVQAYDEHGGKWPAHHEQALLDAVQAARATLAQPEPEGATEDDMNDLADDLLGIVLPEGSGARLITRALELWGHPTIKPVPVAERPWEREGWCDAEGRCWWWRTDGVDEYWELTSLGDPIGHNESCSPHVSYGPCLPHHALPVPGARCGGAIVMDSPTLREIGERLRTQDNRCTADPVFQVRVRRRIYGMDPQWMDDPVWIDTEDGAHEVDPPADPDNPPEFVIQTGYIDVWEVKMVAFTEEGCKEHLRLNGHNYRHFQEVQIYADYLNRCPEMIAIRNALMALPAPTPTSPHPTPITP